MLEIHLAGSMIYAVDAALEGGTDSLSLGRRCFAGARRFGVTVLMLAKVTAANHPFASSVSMRCIFLLSAGTLRFFSRSLVTSGLSSPGRPTPSTNVQCPLDNGTARFTATSGMPALGGMMRPNRASSQQTVRYDLESADF
jgi:hypothetical protein